MTKEPLSSEIDVVIPLPEQAAVRKSPSVAILTILMQTAEIARLRAALERIGNPDFIYSCDDGCCGDEPAHLQHRMDDARATLKHRG